MVILPVAFHHPGANVGRDLVEGLPEPRDGVLIKDAAAEFRHKDQMRMDGSDDMSSGAAFHVAFHRAKL